jgi:hypothetical protein
MKKLILSIIALSAIVFFTSCGDDEKKASNPLVGDWILNSYTAVNCTNSLDNKNETCTVDCEILTFRADMTGADDGEEFEYTITGNEFEFCDPDDATDCGKWAFTVSGDTLTITADYEDCDVTIIYKKG